ncbi:energy transducer TonB [Hymenobacter edaphi]|nr:energy transducer TonB [Hymenobacter edaphi]
MLGVFPFAGLAQATRAVTIKREQPEYFTESYSVLLTDSRTRHGAYAKNVLLNRAVVRGYYHNGQKDSVWTFYYAPSGQVQSRGRYRAGQKAGIWEYRQPDGALAYHYDHTRNALDMPSALLAADTVTRVVEQNGQRQRRPRIRPALFVGGDETRWLGGDGRVRFPNAALKRQASGLVLIEFIIDEQGNATGFRVAQGQDPALDQEALRVTRHVFDNQWLPATEAGKPVRLVYKVPFTFRIN